ncbi:MAG: DUF5686 family protein [Dysgonamonadaceae bacterium]|jgi:hypothetical protein|nr:DUF5686 family protein [Dysgonamonadaceae bacterium]
MAVCLVNIAAIVVLFSGIEPVFAQKKMDSGYVLDTVMEMETVTVLPKKLRYSRRNNPAVDIIKKVIENKKRNSIQTIDRYKVNVYEKLVFSVDYSEKDPLLRYMPVIAAHSDTSELTGNRIINISIREMLADCYYRRQPHTERTLVRSIRHEGFDRTFDVDETLTQNIQEILREVDITDDDIPLMLNRFVSPLSSLLAVEYYHFFLSDTTQIEGDTCVCIAFVPSNPQSYGFIGHLYIVLDGSYAVRKVVMNTSRNINLNWVDRVRIGQTFIRLPGGDLAPRESQVLVSFHPMKGAPKLYANKCRHYGGYDFDPSVSDSVFNLPASIVRMSDSELQDTIFWQTNRPVPLTDKEAKISNLMSDMKSYSLFSIGLKAMEIVTLDYVPAHGDSRRRLFDFGPVHATIARNAVEGFRIRAGGTTTALLHRHLFAGGFAAYGLTDRRWKYQGRLTWSFDSKKYHENEFPVNKMVLLYEYDIHVPGHDFSTAEDNLFAIQAGNRHTAMQYVQRTEIQYSKEWLNNLSVSFAARYKRISPAGTLRFRRYVSETELESVSRITTPEVFAAIRFAPGEKPYNSRAGRSSAFNLSRDAIIFRLSHTVGFRGILGGDYEAHRTEASIEKRIWISSFGHIDALLRGGKEWGRVPFPLLILPAANNTIIINHGQFAMMYPLEFISDRYTSFFMTYYMKGLILNRIPLVNKLKLREVISLSGMYGSLSDRNNPSRQPLGLYELPLETRFFGSKPYMEASVGLENIFRILRVDYFRRLNYLDSPLGVKRHGVRIAFRFSF